MCAPGLLLTLERSNPYQETPQATWLALPTCASSHHTVYSMHIDVCCPYICPSLFLHELHQPFFKLDGAPNSYKLRLVL